MYRLGPRYVQLVLKVYRIPLSPHSCLPPPPLLSHPTYTILRKSPIITECPLVTESLKDRFQCISVWYTRFIYGSVCTCFGWEFIGAVAVGTVIYTKVHTSSSTVIQEEEELIHCQIIFPRYFSRLLDSKRNILNFILSYHYLYIWQTEMFCCYINIWYVNLLWELR